MKTFDIIRKTTVTQEDIDDLFDAAISSPIMHDWCNLIEISKKPEEEYKYLSDVLTRGGEFTLTVDEDDNKYTLKLENFLEAISKVNIDFDDYDSVDADMVVQTAIFGEVVYG